jgi:hypothetical protein
MEGPLPKSARLRTYIDALRNLARSDLPDRVKLIKKNIDLYLEEGQGVVRLRTCAQLSCRASRLGCVVRCMFLSGKGCP